MRDGILLAPHSSHATLLDAVLPEAGLVKQVLLALAGTAVLTLSAKLQVPFWPVPMTMQTFAVLVIAMAFGPKLGAATVLLYLAEGAMGLPVFAGTPAKGIGVAYMMGPTGGYLVGFVLSAFLVGTLAHKGWDRSVSMTLLAMMLGTILIFLTGVIWLATLIGVEKAVQFGLTPFLAGAAFKIALAAAVMPLAWKVLQRSKG